VLLMTLLNKIIGKSVTDFLGAHGVSLTEKVNQPRLS